MKNLSISTCLLIFFSIPLLLHAKGPGGGGGMGGPGSIGGQGGQHRQVVSGNGSGMATLDALLSLSNEELEQLEATIRSIREMTLEQRQAYKERINEYRTMPEADKQSLKMAWGHLDARIRNAWRDYMLSLDEEEREQVRTHLHETAPESRTQWRIEVLREAGRLPEDVDW